MPRQPGHFERHLLDAIAINRSRAAAYSTMSRGRSRVVSGLLIAGERALLPLARSYDRRALFHHRPGEPLLDAIFVPMQGLGPVEVQQPPMPHDRRGRRSRTRLLKQAFRQAGFAGARLAIDQELDRLACHAVDCMRRHLLESARRIATIAPVAVRRAAAIDLPSPEPLLRDLIRLHLHGLSLADRLDDLAFPLQRRGIPILAHDLPSIPAWPAEWHAQRPAEAH